MVFEHLWMMLLCQIAVNNRGQDLFGLISGRSGEQSGWLYFCQNSGTEVIDMSVKCGQGFVIQGFPFIHSVIIIFIVANIQDPDTFRKGKPGYFGCVKDLLIQIQKIITILPDVIKYPGRSCYK